MPGQTPELAEIIFSAIDQRLEALYTTMPGRIRSYDRNTRAATIEVLLKVFYLSEVGDKVFESLPPIPGVPVVLPGDNEYGTSLPLKAGAPCMISFSNSSLDRWKQSGASSEPLHEFRFHPGDCFAVPGAYPPGLGGKKLGNDDEMTIGAFDGTGDGKVVAISQSEVKLGHKDAATPVALKPDLDAIIGALSDATIAQSIYAYGLAPAGPAKVAALAALVTAVNTYFGLHPAGGSTVLKGI